MNALINILVTVIAENMDIITPMPKAKANPLTKLVVK